jgi:hypothetical protein
MAVRATLVEQPEERRVDIGVVLDRHGRAAAAAQHGDPAALRRRAQAPVIVGVDRLLVALAMLPHGRIPRAA